MSITGEKQIRGHQGGQEKIWPTHPFYPTVFGPPRNEGKGPIKLPLSVCPSVHPESSKLRQLRAWHLWIFEKIIFRGQERANNEPKTRLFDFFRQSLIFFRFLKICMFWEKMFWLKWPKLARKLDRKFFEKFSTVLFSSNFWKYAYFEVFWAKKIVGPNGPKLAR